MYNVTMQYFSIPVSNLNCSALVIIGQGIQKGQVKIYPSKESRRVVCICGLFSPRYILERINANTKCESKNDEFRIRLLTGDSKQSECRYSSSLHF